MRSTNPLALWVAGVQTAHLLVEAQTVVSLRLLGLAGLWPVSRSEAQRMWMEKPGAFIEAGGGAAWAAIAGKRPDQIAEAAILPLRRRTRANARRLSRRPRR